jgi:hypothetical protein
LDSSKKWPYSEAFALPLPDLFSIIKFATGAIEGLRDIRPRQESRDKRVQDGISQILRTFYFAPDGILSLLKEVAEGKRPTGPRLQQALVDFNDRQWKIEGAIERLEFGALERELGLSLNSIIYLGSLREGKIDLRSAIQQEVNSYGQKGKLPNKAKVRKLIKAIEELNAAIRQVEGAINRRASVGPLPQKTLSKQKSPLQKSHRVRKPQSRENLDPRCHLPRLMRRRHATIAKPHRRLSRVCYCVRLPVALGCLWSGRQPKCEFWESWR